MVNIWRKKPQNDARVLVHEHYREKRLRETIFVKRNVGLGDLMRILQLEKPFCVALLPTIFLCFLFLFCVWFVYFYSLPKKLSQMSCKVQECQGGSCQATAASYQIPPETEAQSLSACLAFEATGVFHGENHAFITFPFSSNIKGSRN